MGEREVNPFAKLKEPLAEPWRGIRQGPLQGQAVPCASKEEALEQVQRDPIQKAILENEIARIASLAEIRARAAEMVKWDRAKKREWAQLSALEHALIMDEIVRTSGDVDEKKKASDCFRALVEPIMKELPPAKKAKP